LPRKGADWVAVTLPPNEAVTVEEGTRAQMFEAALSDGAAVAVTVEEAEGEAFPAEGAGDVEEQAARGSRRAMTAAATPLQGRRDRIDTLPADRRCTGRGYQGGR
jgi:hypothetical protein